jgi:hypothetical protein
MNEEHEPIEVEGERTYPMEVCDPVEVPPGFDAKLAESFMDELEKPTTFAFDEETKKRIVEHEQAALMANPVVKAVMTMSRVQRRAFQSVLRRLDRKQVAGGLASCFAAARARGWRGEEPKVVSKT